MNTKENDSIFAERIREIRESKGLSMSEVARRIEMDRANYRRIEVEKRDCPISFIYKISKALEVDPRELI